MAIAGGEGRPESVLPADAQKAKNATEGAPYPHPHPLQQSDTAMSAAFLVIALFLLMIAALAARRQIRTWQQRQQMFRCMVESAQDPMFTLDAAGHYLYVNPVSAARLGKTQSEISGKLVDEIFGSDAGTHFRELIREALRTGQSSTTEVSFEIDHQQLWASVLVQPIRNPDGEYTGVLAISRDITDRKRAEIALHENEERLRLVAKVYDIAVFDHDHISGKIYWSPELREYLKLHPGEVAGPKAFRPIIHPEDIDKVEAGVRQAHDPTGDGRYSLQYRIVTHDGSVKWLDTRSKTFFAGEPGARYPRRTIGAMVDITARVQAEEALRMSVHEKETLLREVHHRVKNNLQIISSVLHFQAKKVKDPADLVIFNEARNRLRAMILVHERLYKSPGLARIEFGTYIQALVQDLWRFYTVSVGGRISVHVDSEPIALPIQSALPCGMIVCELVTNSIKYAFPGERTGEIGVALTAAGERVTLTVRDNGIGLPSDFDPSRATTFGWQLISNLAAQMDATLTATGGHAGTQVTLDFRTDRSRS